LKYDTRAVVGGLVAGWLVLCALTVTDVHAQGHASLADSPKLQDGLREFAHGSPAPAPEERGLVRGDAAGRVQVYIRADAITPALRDAVTRLGGTIEGQGLGVLQAWLPPASLSAVAEIPGVRHVEAPQYAQPNVGSVTTEGDAVIRSNLLRQGVGVTGRGVRIGVMSDGIGGLAQSIASGNLPASTFFCQTASSQSIAQRAGGCRANERLVQTTGGVTARAFATGRSLDVGAEGTAMLEIIRDLAPDAELWFVSVSTGVEGVNALQQLLVPNVDVIVSDLGFAGYFPDGASTLTQGYAQALAAPGARARAFVQSAGNAAQLHYAARFADAGTSYATAAGAGALHRFSGPAGASDMNRVTVLPGLTVSIYLAWNDPAGRSTNDYDLLLLDCATRQLVVASATRQQGAQEPAEALQWTNLSATSVSVCYAIMNVGNAAAPRTLNVTVTPLGAVSSHQFNTAASSLFVPADLPGDAIAVGAVSAARPNEIEPFSSLGPTFDGRAKPDVVAPDGVSVSGAGGFPTTFLGTSAAAPHVAGLAALLLEMDPTLTPAQLKSVLMQSAIFLGDPNAFGAGRVDAAGVVRSVRLQDFVGGFYGSVLGREADAAELTGWVSFLLANPTPAAASALVHGFLDGPEYLARPVTLASHVTLLYDLLLGRAPDAAGLVDWVGRLQAQYDTALPGFVASAEFQRLVPDVHDRPRVGAVVTRLYQQVLGRDPSASEVSPWTDYIGATGDLVGVARGFLGSAEYNGTPRTLVEHVGVLYRSFLGRDPTAGEVPPWVGYFETFRIGVEDAFIGSPEFQGRFQLLVQ
jgi:subtilisin family serine protease